MGLVVGERSRFLMVLALVGAITLGAPDAEAVESATISTHLDAGGSGSMIANSQTNPRDEVWSWEACAPNLSGCAAFATGRIVSTAGAAAETVFRATSSYEATAISPVWHGNTVATGPPSVTGPLRANALVTPVAGQWSGGWDGGGDYFQLSACATPAGTRCTTLTHPNYPYECPNTAALLDPFFVGQYLRVADQRLGAGPYVTPSYAVGTPYGHEVPEPGPTISVAVVGRIGPAVGRRAASCGAPPLVEAAISKKGTATVTCGLGCRIVLIAKHGRRTVRTLRKVTRPRSGGLRGPVELQIPNRMLSQLDPGRIHVAVKVNGKQVTRRTIPGKRQGL